MMGDMREQLVLIDEVAPEWRLDAETRETGRRGVAQARAALGPRPLAEPADATESTEPQAA